MPNYIKSIHATKIFDRYNFDIQFNRGINIIYGKNGTGKTTLIHILANALEGNFSTFRHLDFDEIKLEFDDETVVKIFHDGDILRVNREQNGIKEDLFDLDELIKSLSSDESIIFRKNLPSPVRGRLFEIFDLKNALSTTDNMEEKAILQNRLDMKERFFSERFPVLEEDLFKSEPLIDVSYFPAFREMIEAWASMREKEGIERRSTRDIPMPSVLAREWFGPFTPNIKYRSIQMIYDEISMELRKYEKEVWTKERELISNAFLDIFDSLANPKPVENSFAVIYNDIVEISKEYKTLPFSKQSQVSGKIIKRIESLKNSFREEDETARIILNLYNEFLQESLTTQRDNFRPIKNYLESVNKFFRPKKELVVDIETPTSSYEIGVKYENSDEINNLRTLSSGERQILTLVYSATHLSEEKVVLIDEPEISLHVDWQRVLLSRMTEHIGSDKQIIACTHSPTIGADYLDNMIDLSKSNT